MLRHQEVLVKEECRGWHPPDGAWARCGYSQAVQVGHVAKEFIWQVTQTVVVEASVEEIMRNISQRLSIIMNFKKLVMHLTPWPQPYCISSLMSNPDYKHLLDFCLANISKSLKNRFIRRASQLDHTHTHVVVLVLCGKPPWLYSLPGSCTLTFYLA